MASKTNLAETVKVAGAAKHVLDTYSTGLMQMAKIIGLVGNADLRLFPLEERYMQPLKAALEKAVIPTLNPNCVPFLRLLFAQMSLDKAAFLTSVVERLRLFTNEIMDFLDEIALKLPYNVAKDALHAVLSHGNTDDRLWERLGLRNTADMVANRAINIAVFMGNVELAKALAKKAGRIDELIMGFDRNGAMRSLISLDFVKSTLMLEWLIANGFIRREDIDWGFVLEMARHKKTKHVKQLLLIFCGHSEVSLVHKKSLLRVALEHLDVDLLDVLKDYVFISKKMLDEVGRLLLDKMSANLWPYNERQETFQADVGRVKKWVDENYPGLLKP